MAQGAGPYPWQVSKRGGGVYRYLGGTGRGWRQGLRVEAEGGSLRQLYAHNGSTSRRWERGAVGFVCRRAGQAPIRIVLEGGHTEARYAGLA